MHTTAHTHLRHDVHAHLLHGGRGGIWRGTRWERAGGHPCLQPLLEEHLWATCGASVFNEHAHAWHTFFPHHISGVLSVASHLQPTCAIVRCLLRLIAVPTCSSRARSNTTYFVRATTLRAGNMQACALRRGRGRRVWRLLAGRLYHILPSSRNPSPAALRVAWRIAFACYLQLRPTATALCCRLPVLMRRTSSWTAAGEQKACGCAA